MKRVEIAPLSEFEDHQPAHAPVGGVDRVHLSGLAIDNLTSCQREMSGLAVVACGGLA